MSFTTIVSAVLAAVFFALYIARRRARLGREEE
jgi:hypothetical protein